MPTATASRHGAIPGAPIRQRPVRGLANAVATLAMTAGLVLLEAAPALASGDDYPYRAQTDTSASDAWGFTERQCVSFVAWRSHQQGHDLNNTSTTPWGNAYHWDEEAVALGNAVDSTPTVGSIAQWDAGEGRAWTSGEDTYYFAAGSYGHVAYVSAVYSDGTVLLEDYNGTGGDRVFGSQRVPSSAVPRFIHYAG